MYEYLDRRYALALYKSGEEKGKALEYLEELREIVNLIYGSEDMMNLLKHPEISTARKKETFTRLFKDKINDEVLSFLLILIDKDRILYLKEKLLEMEKIHLEKLNTIVAHVKTVVPLLQDEKDDLKQKLETKYSKNIILEESIDESLIGGVYVRVGDDVIDGSVKLKLEEMKALIIKGD